MIPLFISVFVCSGLLAYRKEDKLFAFFSYLLVMSIGLSLAFISYELVNGM